MSLMESLFEAISVLLKSDEVNSVSKTKLRGLQYLLESPKWGFMKEIQEMAKQSFVRNNMGQLEQKFNSNTGISQLNIVKVQNILKNDFSGEEGSAFRMRAKLAKLGMHKVDMVLKSWNNKTNQLTNESRHIFANGKYLIDTVSTYEVIADRLERLAGAFDWFLTLGGLNPIKGQKATCHCDSDVQVLPCPEGYYFQMNCAFYVKLFIYDSPRTYSYNIERTVADQSGLTPNGVTKPFIGASLCMRSTDLAILFVHELIHSSQQDLDLHFTNVLPANQEELLTNTFASLIQILFNAREIGHPNMLPKIFELEFMYYTTLVFKIMFIIGLRQDNQNEMKQHSLSMRCDDILGRFSNESNSKYKKQQTKEKLQRIIELRDNKAKECQKILNDPKIKKEIYSQIQGSYKVLDGMIGQLIFECMNMERGIYDYSYWDLLFLIRDSGIKISLFEYAILRLRNICDGDVMGWCSQKEVIWNEKAIEIEMGMLRDTQNIDRIIKLYFDNDCYDLVNEIFDKQNLRLCLDYSLIDFKFEME